MGKGVVSKIVPDEEMPFIVDTETGERKRVEAILNPYSTVNRRFCDRIYKNNSENYVKMLEKK